MLNNMTLIAEVALDTAENEPQAEPSNILFFAEPNRTKLT